MTARHSPWEADPTPISPFLVITLSQHIDICVIVSGLTKPDPTTIGWVRGCPGRRLADGREWAFPPIPTHWRYKTLVDGRLDLQPEWFPALLREILLLSAEPDNWSVFRGLFRAGALLLGENYWLTSEQCAALIPIDPNRPECVATLMATHEDASPADLATLGIIQAIGVHVGPAIASCRLWRQGRPLIARDSLANS